MAREYTGAVKPILLTIALASISSAQQPASSFREGCGPADPAYIQTPNQTGGILMFLQRSEAAKAFHLVRESTRNNVSTVLCGRRVHWGHKLRFLKFRWIRKLKE